MKTLACVQTGSSLSLICTSYRASSQREESLLNCVHVRLARQVLLSWLAGEAQWLADKPCRLPCWMRRGFQSKLTCSRLGYHQPMNEDSTADGRLCIVHVGNGTLSCSADWYIEAPALLPEPAIPKSLAPPHTDHPFCRQLQELREHAAPHFPVLVSLVGYQHSAHPSFLTSAVEMLTIWPRS